MTWTASRVQVRLQPASSPSCSFPFLPRLGAHPRLVREVLQDLLAAPPGTYAPFPYLTHPFCSALRPKTHSSVLYTWETQDQTCPGLGSPETL